MFIFVGTAYISGFIFGIGKKFTFLFNRDFFTREEHEYSETLIGRLYKCRPIDSVISEPGVQRLQEMVAQDDFRGILKVARDETAISDKPWCVTYIIAAMNSFTMCLPAAVHQATVAYIYGEL